MISIQVAAADSQAQTIDNQAPTIDNQAAVSMEAVITNNKITVSMEAAHKIAINIQKTAINNQAAGNKSQLKVMENLHHLTEGLKINIID